MPAYEVILNRVFADATRGKERAAAKALELMREAELVLPADTAPSADADATRVDRQE
jgi:hypothetical protein